MAAKPFDLYIEQGADFARKFLIQNPDGTVKDLTSCTADAQIRETPSGPIIVSFTCDVTALEGSILMTLTHVQTSAITVLPSTAPQRRLTIYMWDIELTLADSTVVRLLEGKVSVSPEVTHG